MVAGTSVSTTTPLSTRMDDYDECFDGAGEHGEAGARGITFPTATAPARTARSVGVDNHVAELAGESVHAAL